jgi:flagellar FliJ protein
MAFRFSLEAVLQFRQSLEESEEVILNSIAQEIASLQQEMRQLSAQRQAWSERKAHELSRGLPAIQLQEMCEREEQFVEAAKAQEVRLAALEKKRVEQMVRYRAARRDRELLSEMRKQKRHLYMRDQMRQEQKMLDDLFLARIKEKH